MKTNFRAAQEIHMNNKSRKGRCGKNRGKVSWGMTPTVKNGNKTMKIQKKNKSWEEERERERGRERERERNLSQIFQLALDNIPGKGNNRFSFIKTLNFP